jgi:hypothetical protein
MRSHRVLATSIVAFILSAGAGFAPTVTAAAPEDACALLTAAQVGSAVGTPMNEGAYTTPTFKKTCTWTAAHAGANGVKIVTVWFEGVEMFAGGLKAARNPGVSTSSIGGLGDSAYYLTVGNFVALHVKKGGAALKVAVYASLPADRVQAMEKTLAQAVVAKL